MQESKTHQHTITLLMLLLAAFMVGSVVMSLEMLASRYLNPYFGGTIFTWSALISVVLLAMMAGYFIGGYSADKFKNGWVLEGMILIAGLYFITLPYFIDPMLEAVVGSIEDVKYGALLGALILTGLPVACLSTFTPMAIRRTLHELSHTGRISGTIFAVSTAGNIFGTLLTSFYLIPNYGTRALTQSLSVVLGIALVVIICARSKSASNKDDRSTKKTAITTAVILGLFSLIAAPPSLMAAEAPEGVVGSDGVERRGESFIIDQNAAYPEGPVIIKGALYYAEMTRNRVMRVKLPKQGSKKTFKKPEVFFYQKGCGPTSLAAYSTSDFVILCHLSDQLVILNSAGKVVRTIKQDHKGQRIFHPNDCIRDEKGGVYISAPGHFVKQLQPMGHLFYLSASGQVRHLKKNLTYPNGVAIYQGHLYVNEHLNGRVLKFPILKTGVLGKSKIFTNLKQDLNPEIKRQSNGKNKRDTAITGPDGIEISKDGRFYIAIYGAGKILVYDQQARLKKTIKTKIKYPTNITLTPKGHLIITGPKTLDTVLQEGMVYERRL